jgi:hypothetical protein
MLRAPLLSMVTRRRLRNLIAEVRAADLDELRPHIESGAVTRSRSAPTLPGQHGPCFRDVPGAVRLGHDEGRLAGFFQFNGLLRWFSDRARGATSAAYLWSSFEKSWG